MHFLKRLNQYYRGDILGGCMIGECEVCGEQMDEDDWMFTGKVWHHVGCKVI
jgi:hypothetical protein